MGMTNGQAIGGGIGGVLGAVVGFFAGGPLGAVQGALIGFSLGYTLGGIVDPPKVGGKPNPRGTQDLVVNTYVRNQPVPIVYGYTRVWGQVIFVADVGTYSVGGGGGGKKGGGGSPSTTVYSATFAVGLSEGQVGGLDAHTVASAGAQSCAPATGMGVIWADDLDRTCFEGLYMTFFVGDATTTDITARGSVVNPVPWRRTAYLLANHAPLGTVPSLPQLSCAFKGIITQLQTSSSYAELANRAMRATLDYTTNKLYFTLANTSTQSPRGLARADRDGTNYAHTVPPTGFGGSNATRAWYFGMFDVLVMQDRATLNKFWFGNWGIAAGSAAWKSITLNSKLATTTYAWHTDDLNNQLYLLMRDATLQTLFVARIDVMSQTVEVHDIGWPQMGLAFADTLPDAVYFDPEDQLLYVMFHNAAVSLFTLYRAPWQQDGSRKTHGFTSDTGTAQAGSANSITLRAGASATTGAYVNQFVLITGGTGVGQLQLITAYDGATKIATVGNFGTPPDATSTYAIMYFPACTGLAHAGDLVWIYYAGSTGAFGTTIYYDLQADNGPFYYKLLPPTEAGDAYYGATNWGVMQFSQPLSEMIITRGTPAVQAATVANELADNLDISSAASGNGWVVVTQKWSTTSQSYYAATSVRYTRLEWLGSPGGALYDLLTNARYGLGAPLARIDLPSILALDGYASEPVASQSLTMTAYEARYRIDHAMTERRPAVEHLKDMLAGCLSYLVFSNGLLSVRMDRSFLRLVQRLRESEIVSGSVQVSRAARTDRPNRVRVDYLNGAATEQWRHDISESNDEFDQQTYGDVREQMVQLMSVTREVQANRLARMLLLAAAFNRTSITFSVSHIGAWLEIGDRVDITHQMPGFTNKQFKIVDMQETEANSMQITAIEHNPEIYRNEQVFVEPADPTASAGTANLDFVQPLVRPAILELDGLPLIRGLCSQWPQNATGPNSMVWQGIGNFGELVFEKQGINPATGAADAALVPAYKDNYDCRSFVLSTNIAVADTTLVVDTLTQLGVVGSNPTFPIFARVESFTAATGTTRQQETVQVTAQAAGNITAVRGRLGTAALAHQIFTVTLAAAWTRLDPSSWNYVAIGGASQTSVSAIWTSQQQWTNVLAALTGAGTVFPFDKQTAYGAGGAGYLVPVMKGLLLGAANIFNRIDVTLTAPGSLGQMQFALVFLRAITGLDWIQIAVGMANGAVNRSRDVPGVIDGTKGFTQSGSIWFDPPRSWATTALFNASKTIPGVGMANWTYQQLAENVGDNTARYWVFITPVPGTKYRKTTDPASSFPEVDTIVLKRTPFIVFDAPGQLSYPYDLREVGTSVLFHWQSFGRSGMGSVEAPADEPERNYTILGLATATAGPTDLYITTQLPATYVGGHATITASDGDITLHWLEAASLLGWGTGQYGSNPPYGGLHNANFQGFQVTIRDGGTNAIIRSVLVQGHVVTFTYPSAQNIADNGGVYRTGLVFEVRQLSGGVLSAAATYTTV